MTSDIFNKYAEIALQKGIITKEAQEKKKEKKEQTDLEFYYNVKPNGDEEHIMDKAHRDPVYIAPAYDRFNGLVENNFERQDIMAWIARKPADGLLLHRRYVSAQNDLTNELVRLATLLDCKKENELMTLADSCSERLVKKSAGPLIPIVVWKILAWTAAGTALYGAASNNIAMSHGVLNDAESVLNEFNDVSAEWPTSRKEFSSFLEKVKDTKTFASNVSAIKASVRDLMNDIKRTPEGLKKGIEFLDGKYDKGFVSYLESYKENIRNLLEDIPTIKSDVKSVPGRHKQMTEWYEPELESTFWDPLKWLKRRVIGYDPDEAAIALDKLNKSLTAEEPVIDSLIESYKELRGTVLSVKKNPEQFLEKFKEKETEEEKKEPSEIEDLMRFMREKEQEEGTYT